MCHGEKLAGSPRDSVAGERGRAAQLAQIASTIKNGKGRMTGFPNLSKTPDFRACGFSHERREQGDERLGARAARR